jgi:hypothetical protein
MAAVESALALKLGRFLPLSSDRAYEWYGVLKFTGSWLYRGMANHGGMVG